MDRISGSASHPLQTHWIVLLFCSSSSALVGSSLPFGYLFYLHSSSLHPLLLPPPLSLWSPVLSAGLSGAAAAVSSAAAFSQQFVFVYLRAKLRQCPYATLQHISGAMNQHNRSCGKLSEHWEGTNDEVEEEDEVANEEEELHSSKTRGIVFTSNGRHFGIKN